MWTDPGSEAGQTEAKAAGTLWKLFDDSGLCGQPLALKQDQTEAKETGTLWKQGLFS